MFDIEIIFAVFIEEKPAKIGGISDVSDLFKLLWQREINEVFQSGEVNLVETLLDSHFAQSLSVSPCVAVRDAQ